MSSDALETFAAIFTAERKPKLNANADLDAFIAVHKQDIHEIFLNLKKISLQGDEPGQASNYFTLREIMKLEYTIINEPNRRDMLEVFSNDIKSLMFTF